MKLAIDTTRSGTAATTAIEAFEAYMRRRGKAPATLKTYRVILDQFATWAGETPLSEIDASAIEFGFLGAYEQRFHAKHGRLPKPKTVRNYIVALSSLYAFLERFEFISRNPMRQIDPPAIEPKANDWLREDQDRLLLDRLYTDDERIVVGFLRHTGLRVSEFLSLADADVDLSRNEVVVRKSKTARGRRVIPITPELVPVIEQWRTHRLRNLSDPFLLTRNATPWRRTNVARLVRRVGLRVGVEGLSPHRLRRTYGSDLLNRGVRLEVVSRLLGHSSTAITEHRYAELLTDTVREEVLAALRG